jgi:hypothetical protein
MLWRACINMAALQSISSEHSHEGEMKFKSPDYQRSMIELGQSLGNSSDYEKFLLFIGFENIAPDDLFCSVNRPASQPAASAQFIPHLKEKLVWN